MWLKNFQFHVDELCGSDNLKFTTSIWRPNEEDKGKPVKCNKSVEIVGGNEFPYLDLELFWNKRNELNFRVHVKENQKLKYLNSDSTHTKCCLKAIPCGIFGRLAKLTSTSRSKLETRIDKLYPNHTNALEIAGLAPKKYPKLKGILNFISTNNNERRKNRKNSNGKKRTTYFCVGVSDVWSGKNAMHVTLRRLRNKCNLKWLRTSMSYHEFSNLGEIFQGDLNSKIMKNITSKDFVDLDCNCRRNSTVNGNCICGGECRKSIVACKATCTECGCYCIGNTQQKLKNRMNAHFSETKQLVNNDVFSDSFAKHFATHFNDGEKITRGDVRNITKLEILWQGEPMSSIKTFKKLNCNLCAKERIEICKAMKKDKEDKTNFLINSLNEVCGACRHNPKFHRYCTITPKSADEAIEQKKLVDEKNS